MLPTLARCAIFGPLLDDFVQWMHECQGYTLGSASIYLNVVPRIVRWLRQRKINSLTQLTLQDLKAAHSHFRSRHAAASCAACILERFLRARGTVLEGEKPTPLPADLEMDRFGAYLCQSRGFSPTTIKNHRQHLRPFLTFLKFDHSPSRLQQIELRQIEAFLRRSARTNNRFSMQHIVATLRAFLKWRHAQGLLPRPLHLEIEMPRVYRGERLPRALPWDQVQTLVQSTDRSDNVGHRDFAVIYLAAAYGLRSGELVRLSLDDINWRDRRLRISQTKTRQALQLPLTDEAANVLINYLRKARPTTAYRQLFLRTTAPLGPLGSTAIREILARRIRLSGLNLRPCGTQVLRHSFAMRLLQQGVTLKTIGDALGHRDIESTSVYIRLNVDELREVALAVPAVVPGDSVKLIAACECPRIRPARARHHLPAEFQSRFASSLQRYLNLKRALGRIWRTTEMALRLWDDFVRRKYPRAGRVRAEMFTGWTSELAHLNSVTSHNYQRIVRNFLLFYARDHSGTFIPDPLTFPKPGPAFVPRLISETEMGRVLVATSQLPPTFGNPLRAETIRLGLILLFCCGLRRGELLRLRLGDIEEQAVLRIRLTKFYKSRLVPLSPSVADELKEYLQRRRQKKLPMAAESFLMWSGHGFSEVYSQTQLCGLWHQLCVSAQVLNAKGHPPRLHDTRHSFAVTALQRWYAHGADVQAKLPHLATYLGHASPVSTHHYLKLTPELRQAASQRFHQRFASLFNLGGIA